MNISLPFLQAQHASGVHWMEPSREKRCLINRINRQTEKPTLPRTILRKQARWTYKAVRLSKPRKKSPGRAVIVPRDSVLDATVRDEGSTEHITISLWVNQSFRRYLDTHALSGIDLLSLR